MNIRETCKHGNNWRGCLICRYEQFDAVGQQLVEALRDPMTEWKAARRASRLTPQEFEDQEDDDLLPTHPTGSLNQLPVFTVEDQIFLSRRCAIKV